MHPLQTQDGSRHAEPPTRAGRRFDLDLSSQRLLADGRPVPLRPKTFDLLVELARQPNRLLSKHQLLETVWPETYTTETVLKVCIHELRRALGDGCGEPRSIENVYGRGYRLMGEVAVIESDGCQQSGRGVASS